MLNDDNVYQDPRKYNPDRWFNTTIDKSNDPYEIAFGFGRRFVLPTLPYQKIINITITQLDISYSYLFVLQFNETTNHEKTIGHVQENTSPSKCSSKSCQTLLLYSISNLSLELMEKQRSLLGISQTGVSCKFYRFVRFILYLDD